MKITEHHFYKRRSKRLQRRFNENQALLDAILATSADGILVIDSTGKVLKSNRRFKEMWDIPDSLLATDQAQALIEFMSGQLSAPQAFVEEMQGVDSTNKNNGTQLYFNDGRVVERYKQPLPLAGSSVCLWSFRDMTAITRLQLSEQRLFATLELTPKIAVQWYDLQGRVVYWNKASETFYGWTAEEAHGKTLDKLIHTRTEAAAFRALLSDISISGDCIGPAEYTTCHRNGSPLTVLATVFALPSSNSEPIFVCMDVDITQAKQAEEALRLNQQRLSLALQSGNDGLWDWNLETDQVYFSPRWKSMLGYQPDELKDEYLTWYENLHPDDRSMALEKVYDYLEGRSDSYAVEIRMRHKDGHWVDILGRGGLAVDDQGQPLTPRRLVGTHIDITERKAMESALRDREALYSAVVNQAGDGIVLIDIEILGFIECNPAAYEGLGYSRNEFLQISIHDIQAELNNEQINQRLHTILENGHASFITLHRHKDGSIQDTHVSNKVIKLRNQLFLLAIWRNVTEERRMAVALQESELRFRKLFEESALATLLIENGYFVDCNPAAIAMLRMTSREQLLMKTPESISPAIQIDGQTSIEKAQLLFAKTFAEGSQRFECNISVLTVNVFQ